MSQEITLTPVADTPPENQLIKHVRDMSFVERLTPETVRAYLVNGGGKVSDQEVAMFIELCKTQGLNPFIKDAYLVKYGNSPASIITSKDAFAKRAAENPAYKGFAAGVIVEKDGELIHRKGALSLEGETLVGGWAEVYVEGYQVPVYVEADFTAFNTNKANWGKMPALMIRKVALVQAWREAFPESFQGLYSEEEMGKAGDTVSEFEKSPVPDPVLVMASDELVKKVNAGAKALGMDKDWLAGELLNKFGVGLPQDLTEAQAIQTINQMAAKVKEQRKESVEQIPVVPDENAEDIPF